MFEIAAELCVAAILSLENVNKSKNLKETVRKLLKQSLETVLKHADRLSRRSRTENLKLLRRRNQRLEKVVEELRNEVKDLFEDRQKHSSAPMPSKRFGARDS